jgi:3-oxoacyl-[acyl-carrier-protein] synthase III
LTSLQAVANFLPAKSVSVSSYLRGLGVTELRTKVYERYFGYAQIRLDPQQRLVEQLVAAATALDELHGQEHRVRYVLQARTMHAVSPYPNAPLQEVIRALGLRHATAFCVTQHACASGLLALDLAGKLLARDGDPDALALILAGEKSFTTSAEVILNTGIMGEGTAAALVSIDGKNDRILSYATKTHTDFAIGSGSILEARVIFQDVYPKILADIMLTAVECAGLRMRDIKIILPHNVNRMSWLRALELAGVTDVDRLFLNNLPVTAHCFNADAFINYEDARRNGLLGEGDPYLMTSVGVAATYATGQLAATFSSMVLQH